MIRSAKEIMAKVPQAQRPEPRKGHRLNPATGLLMAVLLCSIPDCEDPHASGGYCSHHRYSLERYGDPYRAARVLSHKPDRGCSTPDCSGAHHSKGMCQVCYNASRRGARAAQVAQIGPGPVRRNRDLGRLI